MKSSAATGSDDRSLWSASEPEIMVGPSRLFLGARSHRNHLANRIPARSSFRGKVGAYSGRKACARLPDGLRKSGVLARKDLDLGKRAPGRSRTRNLMGRNHLLYPLSYGGACPRLPPGSMLAGAMWQTIRPLSLVAVAQLVRAPGCDPGGRGFESRRPPSDDLALHRGVSGSRTR